MAATGEHRWLICWACNMRYPEGTVHYCGTGAVRWQDRIVPLAVPMLSRDDRLKAIWPEEPHG